MRLGWQASLQLDTSYSTRRSSEMENMTPTRSVPALNHLGGSAATLMSRDLGHCVVSRDSSDRNTIWATDPRFTLQMEE